MRRASPVLAMLAALAVLPAVSQGPACSKADATKAEKAIERVSTWPQMLAAFKDFRHCDTGAVDELYTESLVRLLVDWKNVDALATAWQDADFKAFVGRHLRSPQAKDDLDSIYSRAKASCPPKQGALCGELADFVKAAEK